jgi:hypothetical protein
MSKTPIRRALDQVCRPPNPLPGVILLAAAALAQAPAWELHLSEAWVELEGQAGRLLMLGSVHGRSRAAWGGSEATVGAPAGLRLALRSEAADWLLQADGAWRRLGPLGWEGIWQAGGPVRHALRCGSSPGEAWLLEDQRLLRVALRAGRPGLGEVRWLPPAQGPAELRGSPGGDWMRRGGRLLELAAGPQDPGHPWPAAWSDWAVRDGEVLGLQPGLGLQDLQGELHLPGAWRQLRTVGDALWLESPDGNWVRWPERGDAVELGRPPRGGEPGWTAGPVTAGWLAQSDTERELWRREDSGWQLQDRWPREARLVDRQARQGADWRLLAGGELQRLDAAGRHSVDRRSGALGLAFAGAGPLLVEEGGLRAYSTGGTWLGSVPRPGMRAWVSLEDWLLGADEDSLVVWWTGEELPWRQAAELLPGVEALAAGGRWAVALAGGSLHLVDLSAPWLPRRRHQIPAPPGTAGLLVFEERLLLATAAGLDVRDLSAGGIHGWDGPQLLPPARWLARRGLDRVLLLDGDGQLRQVRCRDGVPRWLDWEFQLPLAGRLRVRGDSLTVIAEAGWLRMILPPLPAEASPAGAAAASLAGDGTAGTQEAAALAWPNPCRGRLQLARPAGWAGPLQVELVDLLGRRLERRRLEAGHLAAELSFDGRPAGLYWLVWTSPGQPPLTRRVLHMP